MLLVLDATIEHGLTVMTADTDFERFPGVSWSNPLRELDGTRFAT